MNEKLLRVGTTYIPVTDVELFSEWYVTKLEAELNYKDDDKAILNLANQSIFLVKSKESESANFIDVHGKECFSLTFEVDGLEALENMRGNFIRRGMNVGEIEDRGHSGRNFVFYDVDGNKFDVWSELSPTFREKFLISQSK